MAIGSIVSAREMAEEGHHRPSNFDKASVEASPIVVLPHLIRPGLTLFGDRAKVLFPPALHVINSSDDVWEELMEESPPTMLAVLTMADEWVAANIILCVKRDAHGIAFVSQLPIVGASSSGRKVLKRLLAIVAGWSLVTTATLTWRLSAAVDWHLAAGAGAATRRALLWLCVCS